MQYPEKRQVVFLITWISVITTYVLYAVTQYGQRSMQIFDDLPFWAGAMLWTIGGGIVAVIIIQIIFHIGIMMAHQVKVHIAKNAHQAGIKDPPQELDIANGEDEMERLIQGKARGIASAFTGFGFVAGLVLICLNFAPAIMLNVFFISSLVGLIAGNITSLYFYKKGFVHG